jgi:hypothetical protein
MRTLADEYPLLRQEVGMLRARESRRVFDVSVNVGRLAGDRDSFVVRAQDLPAVDAALRIDVLSSLVEQAPPGPVSAWLVRPGEAHPHDLDVEWLSAATVAFGIHARELAGFYAITRSGWLDVRTGERHTWKRLRL